MPHMGHDWGLRKIIIVNYFTILLFNYTIDSLDVATRRPILHLSEDCKALESSNEMVMYPITSIGCEVFPSRLLASLHPLRPTVTPNY
jgi:hypothetical protein